MVRNKEISTSFTVVCKHLIPEDLKQWKCVLEVYSGFMRYRTRVGSFNEIITIKAFGIKALLTCDEEVKEVNFGFLTPEYGQISYLANAFRLLEIRSIRHLHDSIRSEAATWGELVFDINGLPVPNVEFGIQKKDPFVITARKILKHMLKAAKRFQDLGKTMGSSKGKGVDS